MRAPFPTLRVKPRPRRGRSESFYMLACIVAAVPMGRALVAVLRALGWEI